jgi:signal transduction histidine kinase
LGNTFNELLADLDAGRQRERQFLADASHELRSPLAVLAAEVEWVRHRERTPEELSQVLDSIAGQTQRLASLADALLNLEEANESAPTRTEAILISALATNSARPFRTMAGDLGRSIHVTASAANVEVEVRWVELALSNLIANALRHGQGDITIHIAEMNDHLIIEVTDQGPGIPDELGETAFERFARADASRTTPGNGLGLAIVAAVAKRHDGTVARIPGGVRMSLRTGPN